MREQALGDLRRDEGWVPHAYQDSLGYTTIGFGFLIDPEKGGEMPLEVGEFWLSLNVDHLIGALRSALPRWEHYPEIVQRALVNMAYQMGLSGLLGFRKMLALIDEGEYELAADEGLRSRWARQTPRRAGRVTEWIRYA